MARLTVGEVLDELTRRKRSMRCSEVCGYLRELGYEVRSGRAGHKVYGHPGIPEWTGSNFDCGHGKDGTIRVPYVLKIRRVIESHAATLRKLGGEP